MATKYIMKKTFLFLVCSLFAIAITSSCSSEGDVPIYNEENIDKFVELGNNEIPSSVENSKIDVVIFSVTIHRPKRDCLRGLGFCKFEWFPSIESAKISSKVAGTRNLVLKSDSEGDFVEIFVSKPIPNDIPSNLLNLVVEKELETTTINGDIFKIEAGNYPYDKNLGDFGGYKIYLK